jgi:AcrR family transcriptional regulator
MPAAKRAYRSPIRELQAQFTRGAILDAAAQSFIETGYANTTVKDIAGRAGVSAHTVHLLGTKSFLLLAAVDRALSDSNDGRLTRRADRSDRRLTPSPRRTSCV